MFKSHCGEGNAHLSFQLGSHRYLPVIVGVFKSCQLIRFQNSNFYDAVARNGVLYFEV